MRGVIMEQHWKYTIKYSHIDDAVETYKSTCSLSYDASVMFKYITDYIKTGTWADEHEDYHPSSFTWQGQPKDTLTHARWYLSEILNREIHWRIAKRCVSEDKFADDLLKQASQKAKLLNEYEKKRYQNERRCLREHKKKRKNLFSDYCYFVGQFVPYQIIDFDCELIETK